MQIPDPQPCPRLPHYQVAEPAGHHYTQVQKYVDVNDPSNHALYYLIDIPHTSSRIINTSDKLIYQTMSCRAPSTLPLTSTSHRSKDRKPYHLTPPPPPSPYRDVCDPHVLQVNNHSSRNHPHPIQSSSIQTCVKTSLPAFSQYTRTHARTHTYANAPKNKVHS